MVSSRLNSPGFCAAVALELRDCLMSDTSLRRARSSSLHVSLLLTLFCSSCSSAKRSTLDGNHEVPQAFFRPPCQGILKELSESHLERKLSYIAEGYDPCHCNVMHLCLKLHFWHVVERFSLRVKKKPPGLPESRTDDA